MQRGKLTNSSVDSAVVDLAPASTACAAATEVTARFQSAIRDDLC